MTAISLSSYSSQISSVNNSIKSHKTSPIAKDIKGVCNTNNEMPSNLVNMKAVPADSLLDDAGKLTDSAKELIKQEINELSSKNSAPTSEQKAALFWKHAIPLLKAKLNEVHSNTPLLNIPADQTIDDSTLGSHFINQKALQGKLERFSNQIDSFQEQKLASAKEIHLQNAFRALEESIETLIIPDSPPAKSEPEFTASERLKQPTTGSDNVDSGTPVNEATKSQTTSGDVHYHTHYHFHESISRIGNDKESVNINVTVNGDNITSSVTGASNEKKAQQTLNVFDKPKNTVAHEQVIQTSMTVESETLTTNEGSNQVTTSQQDISLQPDDYIVGSPLLDDDIVDGSPLKNNPFIGRVEDHSPRHSEIAESREKQPSTELPQVPLLRSQSESDLSVGNYQKVKDSDGKVRWKIKTQPHTSNHAESLEKQSPTEFPQAPLLRSQSEPDLSVGNYQKVKDSDGKVRWEIKTQPHASNHIVLTNGTRQTANNAGTLKYFNNDSRRIEIDGVNKSGKATETEEMKLSTQENLGRTLNVNVNMDINENQTEAEISGVDISISPTNDVQGVDSSNINSRTGQPFKYSVSADKNVILTRDGQVSSLANKRSYSESDLRFKIEKSS
ncbi:hypothetical protein [Providencia stuartii]|uniref:hypothetical protein n=1 Tax=Providencia stuartii TaxID=588 RepID=UPI00300272EF